MRSPVILFIPVPLFLSLCAAGSKAHDSARAIAPDFLVPAIS
jgi:hypothetical protein